MRATLRALLTGVMDYAGLFPPAKLPLDAAFGQFLRYRAAPECWLLNKFICPAAQLPELSQLIDKDTSARELSFSILGRGGSDGAEFLANLEKDCALLEEFRSRQPGATIAAFEVRLPADLACAPPSSIAHLPWPLAATVAIEISPALDWQTVLPTLLAAIHAGGPRFAFKLRCGGLDAAAFPSVEHVALTLHECRATAVPVKFTAGLHHPFRHWDAQLATPMHGFINIFAAGPLALANDLNQAQTCKILADEKPGHFRFDDDALRWHDLAANIEQTAAARRELVTSFGSCSFDEPIDDLRRLGLFD